MAVCTFFGHRDCPEEIRGELREAVIDLIVNRNVDRFYLGNQGGFDSMVHSVLRELKGAYPQIEYTVVLAYFPEKPMENWAETMLPEGIETVPRRFAISWRNRWMLENADFVVAYVTHDWGGAAKYAALAEKQGKPVHYLGSGLCDFHKNR